MWLPGLLAVLLLFTAGCNPNESTSQSNSFRFSHGCTGSQTVTVHDGDTLTVLVQNHVSGSFATQQIVDIVVRTNGIANRNVIHANQRIRLPATCSGR